MNSKRYSIPRRSFLRGAGVSIALPWLDIMSQRSRAASMDGLPPTRLCVLYKGCGVNPHSWDIVGGTETDFEFSHLLKPLAPVREDVLILGNLDNQGSSDHMDAPGTFMSATRHRDANRYSFDQRIADTIGHHTPIKSLQLTADKAWKQHPWLSILSYDKDNQPLRGQHDPQTVFNELFRDFTQGKRDKELTSVLDGVKDAAYSLRRKASERDKKTLEQYFDAIRDVEVSIEQSRQNRRLMPVDEKILQIDPNLRIGNLGERIKAMLDLITLAFWTDSTRVISCMLANTNSRSHYDFMGVNAEFHYVSHHVRNKKVLPDYDRINLWHTGQLKYLIEKLKGIKEGDSSLFDHALILWGSGIKHGDYHSLTDLPLILTGGAGGKVSLGRHVRYPQAQPHANLLLSIMNLMGCSENSIGDSTGLLDGISGAANFKALNPDDGSWQVTQVDSKVMRAKGLLHIRLDGEVEYYQLQLSDKTKLDIRIPYMNNHRLRFDRGVGKVVTVEGEYQELAGKKTIISLSSVEIVP